ncbi:MAG: lysophospholipid acyltransferase family protein [Planctomycetota bacterium]|jgi:putative phosphoserine phosphatase / 1-acylglycerol-3-phosphate O-acyltransferase|nr:lysophospholipid acyltransferase family protein [Planctomycetota bacterium]
MFVCTFGLAGIMVALATCFPRFFHRHRLALVRSWGRTGLFISGIHLETVGREHLTGDSGRIVLFNHQSLLDLFILAALWAPGAVVIYKQEFHQIPIMGRLMKEMDLIPVDRSNREQAVKSLKAAGERIRVRREALLVAPEGTRSLQPGLIDFKRGPFHVALETGLPMIPFVMRGVRSLLPAGHFISRSGFIRVDVLPPISTTGWVETELDARITEVRDIFLRYLPDAGSRATKHSQQQAGTRPQEADDVATAAPQ